MRLVVAIRQGEHFARVSCLLLFSILVSGSVRDGAGRFGGEKEFMMVLVLCHFFFLGGGRGCTV